MSFNGRTSASQAENAGSIPVIRSIELLQAQGAISSFLFQQRGSGGANRLKRSSHRWLRQHAVATLGAEHRAEEH